MLFLYMNEGCAVNERTCHVGLRPADYRCFCSLLFWLAGYGRHQGMADCYDGFVCSSFNIEKQKKKQQNPLVGKIQI